ncbi:SDR family NAD(P)-dependent oxidoreductase [Spongiivirga citrea]|uniref:SDR family oxidoreductase n=1 Tax=Spongiivirga citrea TaxID=1481457 RepID=A0A6M0CN22_9FLAO|nr:SDR family oxidoreductase [Spongiivirga citrea]NER17454.1 SDR family oxidoreductase [Spongiivirga citrea]
MGNILLIGGSYGIGNALAKKLAQNNNLYIASRTNDGLKDINCNHIQFDASTDTLDISQLPNSLDGFVYCPGSIDLKPFKMLKYKSFLNDININYLALVKVVQTIMPLMAESEQASMVFFSTVAVKVGMPFHTSVAGAKGAVEGFAKALAAEYAPSIRVNVIAPSLTDTPLAKRLLNHEKKVERMNERHPLKRVGTAEDIANIASFLIQDQSSWITGQVFGVDGGMSTLNVS